MCGGRGNSKGVMEMGGSTVQVNGGLKVGCGNIIKGGGGSAVALTAASS